MFYNILNDDNAFHFILDFFNIDEHKFINEYFYGCNCNFEKFLEKYRAFIESVDISNLDVYAVHYTGSIDNCESIKKYGIKNVRDILTFDNPVENFLENNNIEIDLDKRTIEHSGVKYEIKPSSGLYNIDASLNSLYSRLYSFYEVCGFLFCKNIIYYGSSVDKNPEIIEYIASIYPDLRKSLQEWNNTSKSFKITFYANISEVDLNSFDMDKHSINDLNEDELLELKIQMLRKAYNVYKGYEDELYFYLDKDKCVKPEQIVTIEKL